LELRSDGKVDTNNYHEDEHFALCQTKQDIRNKIQAIKKKETSKISERRNVKRGFVER